ncbi:MAG: glutamate ligase domain-containing protein, partial [Butyrivibrio sp.]
IIKEGIPVVSGKQHKIAADIIKSTALKNKSEYYFTDNDIVNIRYGKDKTVFDYHEFQNIEITLLGTYQPENAVTAIECAKVLRNLGIRISDNDIYSGLKKAVWFGRFSKLGEHPDFIVDGAHNPAGALKLAECLETYYPLGGLTFIMGVFADKDYESILKYCMPYAKSVITIETPDNSRALSSKALAEFIKNNYDVSIHVSNSIEEGVGFAMDNTDTDKAIIAFGSLSHLCAVHEAYISLT